MSNEKMREEFEFYALDVFGDYFNKAEECLVRSHDTYVYGLVHTAWRAWQASRAAVVVELPQQSGVNLDWNQAIRYCYQAIEAAGLKVAP